METKVYGSITITDVTDGKSAYEIWLEQGNEGTEEDYLASLKGDAGRGEKNKTELYYVSASDKNPPEISDSSMASGYWKTDFPTQWNNNTYIWTTTKTEWTDGDVTYSPNPARLISQIEAATLSAQLSGASLADWCVANNVTIIDGSTIATGTITADQMAANSITSSKIATDAITSRNYYKKDMEGKDTSEPSGEGMKLDLSNGVWDSKYFKIDYQGNISATGGTIGGWTMEDGKFVFDSLSSISDNMGLIEAGEIRSANYNQIAIWKQENETEVEGSVGLDFAPNSSESEPTAYVVSGRGTCEDEDIIIPSKYNGLPVTAIGQNAFMDDSILKSISIPNSVSELLPFAFGYCYNLITIQMDFSSIEVIHSNVFSGCTSLKNVTLPESIETIGAGAFARCESLNYIMLPESIQHIELNAFRHCDNLTGAYYKGTEEQWNQISLADGNDNLTNALYFYSASKPTSDGNYWYSTGFKISCNDEYMINSNYFKVTSDGRITATSGSIGGCTISEDGAITSANGNFQVDSEGNLIADNADLTGVIDATGGNIGGWSIGRESLTNYGGVQDSKGYYPNSFCMQIKTETNGAVNALAIGKCKETTWGQAAFRVMVDGKMYATNGKIGDCEFQSIRYPVVDEDLATPTFYRLSPVWEGLKQIPYFKYYVRFSPADDYSQKTFEPYSSENGATIDDNETYFYYWYYGWTNSPDAPPNTWTSSEIYFSTMDTSIIETHPYFWLRCVVAKQTGFESDELIDTIVYYIGDFSGYLTVFNIDGGSLNIGSNIITGKASSIKFEDNCGRLAGTWYGTSGTAISSWRGVKSNIEELDNRYSILFDELQPVRFIYNNGQSNRYHTGLILDGLKEAMDKAGIDTSELAAYCISNEATGEGGIRYSELISLCIDQIQKLKARVTELEDKLTTTQND